MEADGARLDVFIRFLAKPGREAEVERVLASVLAPTRAEPGCLSIQVFRSIRDGRLFYIHSRWRDEAAFDHHADLPHTVAFVEEVEPLIEDPVRATRTRRLA